MLLLHPEANITVYNVAQRHAPPALLILCDARIVIGLARTAKLANDRG